MLDKFVLESEGSFIDTELLIKSKLHGFKITQFGVDYFPRNRGTSTLASPDVIIKMIQELVAFRLLKEQKIALTSFARAQETGPALEFQGPSLGTKAYFDAIKAALTP